MAIPHLPNGEKGQKESGPTDHPQGKPNNPRSLSRTASQISSTLRASFPFDLIPEKNPTTFIAICNEAWVSHCVIGSRGSYGPWLEGPGNTMRINVCKGIFKEFSCPTVKARRLRFVFRPATAGESTH